MRNNREAGKEVIETEALFCAAARSGKAFGIFVSQEEADKDGAAVWLPTSQCSYIGRDSSPRIQKGTLVKVSGPRWLLEKEGLV